MKTFSAKKVATLGVLTALSLIAFMLESLLPPLFIPGAKIGVANVFTLVCICLLSPMDGIILVVARTVLSGVIVGSLSSMIYSLVAGLSAAVIMAVLYRFFKNSLSIVAVSVVGAAAHNAAQCIVFFLTTKSSAVFYYMPYLLAFGIFSGAAVGALATLAVRYGKSVLKSAQEKR